MVTPARHQSDWTYLTHTLIHYRSSHVPNGEITGQRWWRLGNALIFLFDLCLNKRLSKQSWGWWFETPSCSFWCHCNDAEKRAAVIKQIMLDRGLWRSEALGVFVRWVNFLTVIKLHTTNLLSSRLLPFPDTLFITNRIWTEKRDITMTSNARYDTSNTCNSIVYSPSCSDYQQQHQQQQLNK